MITPKVSDIVGIVNKIAPHDLAEEWDNVGLMVGNPSEPATRIMVALDGTPDTIDAAIADRCQLLLTHHPFIFRPLKHISSADPIGRLVLKAASHSLAVISLHTNFDIASGGMNDLLAERLGVSNCRPLKVTTSESLVKLVVFVPKGHEEQVRDALFLFSGVIGAYRDCSFQCAGTGTFKPLAGAQPFIGQVGTREYVEESRIEVLLEKRNLSAAVTALVKAHPYEEPAFDLFPLLNRGPEQGLGRIGVLAEETTVSAFADEVKGRLGLAGVRFVGDGARPVRKVALCGGSGMSLLRDAQRQGADVLVTGDVKYHEARDAEALGVAIVDGGHFGTEVLMVESVAKRMAVELASRRFEAEVIPFCGERDPFTWR
ncbi:Nif3-like dinuclear metal center hexameric protein [Geobacter hydrogenophilus]|uniref:GTP cyclohydrolase 1 type 2 homolog n=1 Tax=Geobacter hydrogenophilus TaxID=40983 RepID=A0A9W6G140_9BACT|nr:Nif3-like dinuclear metal center hexameric protein [Geobacter hydrogenophilus]MBT0894275.1 Nif3-like dinuclear metal center hexameric protein [Geobacter hydrogenophilus]GLI38438.1 GTP cyclohydrolase 1 type 2 [Geobacter hydrogenophilus]